MTNPGTSWRDSTTNASSPHQRDLEHPRDGVEERGINSHTDAGIPNVECARLRLIASLDPFGVHLTAGIFTLQYMLEQAHQGTYSLLFVPRSMLWTTTEHAGNTRTKNLS